jgi:hypothetical protein
MISEKSTIEEPPREGQGPLGTDCDSSPGISIRQIVVPTDLKPHGQKTIH